MGQTVYLFARSKKGGKGSNNVTNTTLLFSFNYINLIIQYHVSNMCKNVGILNVCDYGFYLSQVKAKLS